MNQTSRLTVLVLGAGNMGAAVGKAVLASGVRPEKLLVLNSSAESSSRAAKEIGGTSAFAGVVDHSSEYRAAVAAAVGKADVVVLGIKPYQLPSVLPSIAHALSPETLVVSLAAGASLETLQGLLNGHGRVIRTMPNTPVAVGSGVVALMRGLGASDADVELTRALLSDSATVVEIPESHVHSEIAAAGSAPAFFYLVAEAMIDEAVAQGLTRDVATQLVVETMKGSAKVLAGSDELPAAARYAVTSPGGTTARGVASLEESGIRAAFARAMRATAERSRELEAQ